MSAEARAWVVTEPRVPGGDKGEHAIRAASLHGIEWKVVPYRSGTVPLRS